MKNIQRFLEYLDVFGTEITFYSDKKPKLYTVNGGILSIISIISCILCFIFFSLDDFYRKIPNTTTSSIPSEGYRKVKFGKEKIWIPWRIVDYNNNEYVNHTGLLFPIIYYYFGVKDKITKNFNLSSKILNYKLCNETSMPNYNNIYQITIPLNEIYCIEMEDLDMGGSWITEFINYIQFDIYYCQDGINYDEKNPNCSSFEKIINYMGENNSLEIDIYYPIVQFQPTNKTFPVIVIYRQYFYHLSRYMNKIDRLFLQEHVLTDDTGWILKKENNNSFWGLNSISGDYYFTGNENDLMNEGSNSRAYSINLYLEPGIIHYKRYYKKLYTIFTDFFPIIYIIFVIMKNISKIFKKADSHQKLIELLFENLKEKPIMMQNNFDQLKVKNNGRLISNKDVKEKNDEIIFFNENEQKFSIKLRQNSNNNINNNFSPSPSIKLNRNENNNNILENNISSSNYTKGQNFKNIQYQNKSANNSSKQKIMVNDTYFKINNSIKNINGNVQNIHSNNSQKRLIKEKLFPYKYYFFSVFIRNLDISKKSLFLSRKYSKVYIFLCQLIDITAYLSLQKEFNILKKILSDKNINIIGKYQKINISAPAFIQDINDCIEKQKFHILAKGVNHK
jgi:hypothetical protein